MGRTKIEWTDKVWNPVTGCSKVSAGCKNCYAERQAKRFWGDRKFTDVRFHQERLEEPHRCCIAGDGKSAEVGDWLKVGKRRAGRLLDVKEWNEMPEVNK